MKVLFLEAEPVIGRRDRVLGVVADDEEARARVAFDAPVGRGAQIFLWKSIQTSLHAGQPSRLPFFARPLPGGKKKA